MYEFETSCISHLENTDLVRPADLLNVFLYTAVVIVWFEDLTGLAENSICIRYLRIKIYVIRIFGNKSVRLLNF